MGNISRSQAHICNMSINTYNTQTIFQIRRIQLLGSKLCFKLMASMERSRYTLGDVVFQEM